MSLLAAAGTALSLAKTGSSLLSKFGIGDSGPNIAKKFSKRVGCTILQKDKAQAEALIARGINPCTGQASGGGPVPTNVQSTMERVAGGLRTVADVIGPRPGDLGYDIPGKEILQIPAGAPYVSGSIIPPGGPMSLLTTSMSSVGALARTAGGLLRTSTGRISSIVLPSGVKYSRRKAATLLKRVGLEVGAAALGISLVQAAELLLADAQAPRRRRGISAANLRNAKRVNCAIRRMHADLGLSKTAPRRRTSCR